jgi:hypothetical protein
MEPPTPRPELLDPIGTGSAPEMTRGSVQYRWCDPASSLTQSVSGFQKGPASSTTTDQPCLAIVGCGAGGCVLAQRMARSTSSLWS